MFRVVKVDSGVISVLVVFWDISIVSLSNYLCSYLLWYYLLSVLMSYMVFSAVTQLSFLHLTMCTITWTCYLAIPVNDLILVPVCLSVHR